MKCQNLVLKVASRCNLNCTYCYMYNMDDKSYKLQPKLMSDRIVDATIKKSFNHCKDNNIKEFLFAFHGGEPLLQKKSFYIDFVDKCKKLFSNEVNVYYSIQTNGTLLTKEWASLFNDLKIQIGVSLDGVREVNDINRLYKKDKSSFDDVLKGIENALQFDYHKKSLGLLTVINPHTDPLALYDLVKDKLISNIDFLFPYNTYDSRPEGYDPMDISETPYADWLITIFDFWYKDQDDYKPNVRMFKGFIECLLGGEYPNDLFGSYQNGLLVIETNGEIEAVDYLKSCGDNFTKTNMNILTNDISESSNSDLIELYYNCHTRLSQQCSNCIMMEICGGGNLTSRFSKQNGFDNASLFCKDYFKLINHIQNIVFKDLPDHIVDQFNLVVLPFKESWNNSIFQSSDYNSPNSYLESFRSFQQTQHALFTK